MEDLVQGPAGKNNLGRARKPWEREQRIQHEIGVSSAGRSRNLAPSQRHAILAAEVPGGTRAKNPKAQIFSSISWIETVDLPTRSRHPFAGSAGKGTGDAGFFNLRLASGEIST